MSTDEEMMLATARGYAATARNNRVAAEMRIRMNHQNHLLRLDTQCIDLTRANTQLKTDNEALTAVMNGLLDRCEALDRVVRHLQTAWQPRNASANEPAPNLDETFNQVRQQVAQDAEWQKDRERVAQGWKDWGKTQVKARGRSR